MAGGPSTPALAAAVSDAGGLGFLAAGYRAPSAVRGDIERLRELTDAPFGVNLFLVSAEPVDDEAVAAYARRLASEGPVGEAAFDDDGFDEKLAVVLGTRPAAVSFTFGCPRRDLIERLHAAGIAVWVTVTEADEAEAAREAGADVLIVQGYEAGGHRGTWDDADGRGEVALLPLLRLVARGVDLPLVAAGGIADGAGIAAALAAGARAAQIGTAFLRCPEAGTSRLHRDALRGATGGTGLTRAFTGRRARGIRNRFMLEHEAEAPRAYPQVQRLVGPRRAAAAAAGDADSVPLWAGQAYPLGDDRPAADVVRRLAAEARAAFAEAAARLQEDETG